MKNIKVTLLDPAEFTELHTVEARDVEETALPMALTRAVAALCVAVGLPTPGQEFARVARDTGHAANDDSAGSATPLGDAAELRRIDQVLFTHGAEHHGVRGVLELINKQAQDALPGYKLLSALGPQFAAELAKTREAFRAVTLADTVQDLSIPDGKYQRALTALYGAVGNLLQQLRAVNPEDRPGPGGSTIVTLTEAVELPHTSLADTGGAPAESGGPSSS